MTEGSPADAWTARIPVAAALLLHGVEAKRWMIAVPAAIAVLAGVRVGPWRLTEGRAWAAALAGAGVGALIGTVVSMPTGAFPVVPYSAVCGAGVVLAVYLTYAHAWIYAWIAAFLVAILGAQGELDVRTVPVEVVTAVVTLACFLYRSGVAISARAVGFFGSVVVGTLLGGVAVAAAQGAVARASEGWLTGEIFASGFGFSGSLSLSPTSSVSASDRVVIEVTGRAPDRLRLGVLDVFDGDSWTRSPATSTPGTPAAPGQSGDPAQQRRISVGAHQTLRPFIPAPRGVQTLDGVPAALDPAGLLPGTLAWGEQRDIGWTDDPPDDPPGADATTLPEPLRAQLLPLTAPLVPPGADAAAIASAFELYLSTKFKYSLTAKLAGDAPPLVILLRDHRPAYCIYFASAMAAMLRVEGIPSRLVTGYLVEPPNDLSGRALARERDAHAWVEAWIPAKKAWITYDPTPDREAEPEPSDLDVLRRAIAEWLEWQAFRFAAQPVEFLKGVLLSSQTGAGLGLAVAYAVVQRWRQRDAQGDAPDQRAADPRLGPIYLRYRRALRRAGVSVGRGDSEEAVLVALEKARGPAARAAAERFIECYQRARFRGDVVDVEAELAAVERGVRGGPTHR